MSHTGCLRPRIISEVLGEGGVQGGGRSGHQQWWSPPLRGECTTLAPPPFPWQPVLRLGACAPAFACMVWGRLWEQGCKHKPDEGGARGCLGAGGGPRACGWVTLYNYNTVVKAPEPRWRRAGDAGFPSAQTLWALNGLVLFGLELTVVCVFHPPPICSLSLA